MDSKLRLGLEVCSPTALLLHQSRGVSVVRAMQDSMTDATAIRGLTDLGVFQMLDASFDLFTLVELIDGIMKTIPGTQ